MSCRNTATQAPILKGGVYFRNEKQWMVKQVDYENVGRKRMQCVYRHQDRPDCAADYGHGKRARLS